MNENVEDRLQPTGSQTARRCAQCGGPKDRPRVKTAMMSVDQAAKYLGVSRAAAYDAVERGEIPAERIGDRVVIPIGRLREKFGLTGPNDAPF